MPSAFPQQVSQTQLSPASSSAAPSSGAQAPSLNVSPFGAQLAAPKEEPKFPDSLNQRGSASSLASSNTTPPPVNSSWQQIPVSDSTEQSQRRTGPKLDKYQRLEQRIEADPWDSDAWTALLAEANQRGDPQVTRDVFERFLKQFPTSARHWVSYADFEMRHKENAKLEQIFTRCLRSVPDVDLCKFYLNYIRRRFSGGEGEKRIEARNTISKAYEFVVGNIGVDKDSGTIWSDYLYFIKSGETTNAFEEGQKIDLYRRTFHRAVATPLSNIEQLWKDYDNWENQLNKLTAKKFVSDKSPTYMNARTALKELRTLMEPIEKIQKLWFPKPPQWSEKELQMVDAWRKYIAWERTDPIKLGDKMTVASRVIYAYKRCLLMLRNYPQIWMEAASYMAEVGKAEEGYNLLKTGAEAMPTCISLHLHLAENYETQGKVQPARQIYENLITNLETQLTTINGRADAERARVALDQQERRMKETEVAKRSLSLTWVFYMRFGRRTENVKGARAIFGRARKSPHCTYHVFVASALMEHYLSKDAIVAGKIFELGLKVVSGSDGLQNGFSSDGDSGDGAVQFSLQYLSYLISQNDENSENTLFERAIATIPPSKARPVWEKFVTFESEYGDLGNLAKIEKRRQEVYPDGLLIHVLLNTKLH
ncbi:Suf-domain-containing protein [Gonapodya prolifera JEL478]|uniref:Suf-domain-containing protein n=1 Tax=Gonapodya prolifera (strain JEL478) TaxID=1344416 RepID=A0A139AMP1_GONPJ|nr:Suf-domain-containing protein [Gonapodya prolifera JEL478]|eukprot:KXS17978.1 Suf-domain-containing protein [Gonapodya prolifera JEL478]